MVKKIINSFFLFTLLFIYLSFPCFSQQTNKIIINSDTLVEIPRLSSYEILFKEYSKTVENNYKLIAAGKTPEIMFFKYTNTEKFTLQGLASRCNINYDTIATLNQIESASESILGKTLILPTVQGLYIPINSGENSIEILLRENFNTQNANETLTKNALWYNINSRDYYFFPGKRLSSTERAYFLDSALRLPLEKDAFWVSSEFGKRKNPFSGKMRNHNGIDLAAAEGTPVYAVKDGAVAFCIENDSEFGNYLILQHDSGKTTSVYAHLQRYCVEQYQNVKKGEIIGYVGHSGMATGDHLHFEIRQGGKAEDPRNLLRIN